MVTITVYTDAFFAGVAALWEDVFPNDPPWNKAAVAIPAKLAVQPELFLVALDGAAVIGTAMAGYDGHRGWLYAIAVKPDFQRKGIGTALLHDAEKKLGAMGCSKINLQIRADNAAVAAFYREHGYAVEDRISMGKRMLA